MKKLREEVLEEIESILETTDKGIYSEVEAKDYIKDEVEEYWGRRERLEENWGILNEVHSDIFYGAMEYKEYVDEDHELLARLFEVLSVIEKMLFVLDETDEVERFRVDKFNNYGNYDSWLDRIEKDGMLDCEVVKKFYIDCDVDGLPNELGVVLSRKKGE